MSPRALQADIESWDIFAVEATTTVNVCVLGGKRGGGRREKGRDRGNASKIFKLFNLSDVLSLLMALLTKSSPSADWVVALLLPEVTQLADICPRETIAPC